VRARGCTRGRCRRAQRIISDGTETSSAKIAVQVRGGGSVAHSLKMRARQVLQMDRSRRANTPLMAS
jgi:hypothetical protein